MPSFMAPEYISGSGITWASAVHVRLGFGVVDGSGIRSLSEYSHNSEGRRARQGLRHRHPYHFYYITSRSSSRLALARTATPHQNLEAMSDVSYPPTEVNHPTNGVTDIPKTDREKEDQNDLVFSYLTLRNLIGICGILLPI